MQVLPLSHGDKDFFFPLTQAPINFLVFKNRRLILASLEG